MKGVSATGCVFSDIGGRGFTTTLEHTSAQQDATGIRVLDSVFEGCGAVFMQQPFCVFVSGKSDITVAHNDISQVAALGISSHPPFARLPRAHSPARRPCLLLKDVSSSSHCIMISMCIILILQVPYSGIRVWGFDRSAPDFDSGKPVFNISYVLSCSCQLFEGYS